MKTLEFISVPVANGNDLVTQRIAPYCDAPQTDRDGNTLTQHFTRASATAMADAFNSSIRRLMDKLPFGTAALPCYNGHPDHVGSRDEDTTVYARVEKLEARDDGLWATIRKFPALEALKNTLGRLEISPRWLCRPNSDGLYEPFKLLSLGFVTKGNLPNAELINSESQTMNEELIKQLAEMLGIEGDAATQDPTVLVAALADMKSKVAPPAPPTEAEPKAPEPPKKPEEKPDDKPEDKKKDDDKPEDKEVKAAPVPNAAVEYGIRAKLDAAIAEGRITVAQKEAFRGLLEKDFANTAAILDSMPRVVTKAGQAAKAAEVDAANRARQFANRNDAFKQLEALANEHMAAEKCDFDTAFRAVINTKEGSALYGQTL